MIWLRCFNTVSRILTLHVLCFTLYSRLHVVAFWYALLLQYLQQYTIDVKFISGPTVEYCTGIILCVSLLCNKAIFKIFPR